MDKELEEAIRSLNKFAYTTYGTLSVWEARTILNYIKKSIPKKELEELIEQNTYPNTYNFKTIEVSKLKELLEDKK